MKFIRKYGRNGPNMLAEAWQLLTMYTYVVNHELKKRKLPVKGSIEIMSAICSHYLLAIQSKVLDDYKAALTEGIIVRNQPAVARAATVFGASFPTDFPSLLRVGGRGLAETEDSTEENGDGPVFWPVVRQRASDHLRLPGSPGKVRGRNARRAGAVDAREQIRRAVERTRT
jgi:hypothetical protein